VSPSAFRARYGPWALVAGASEGIGAEFARALAARGLNLVLLARRAEPLEALRRELSSVEVRTATLDLAAPGLAARLEDVTRGLEVGLAVANAALSLTGPFLELDLEQALRTVDLNVRAPLVVAHVLGRAMAARGRGGLVFMSSLAGLVGGPQVAAYAGTRAFALQFGESLWGELQPRGVDVVTVAAGPTRTPTYTAVQTSSFPPVMEAPEVVEAALATLGAGPRVVPGWFNRASGALLAHLPRAVAIRLIAAQTRKYTPRTS
jgi:short-subunit dehydrogenase